jgi:hypothetical protein
MDWAVQKPGLPELVAVWAPVGPILASDLSASVIGSEPVKLRRVVIPEGAVRLSPAFHADQIAISWALAVVVVTDGATGFGVVPV